MTIKERIESIANGETTAKVWKTLKSPKTLALLKLGAAIVSVVHAVDEFVNVSNKETNDD